MLETIHIDHRVNALKLRSAQKYNIPPQNCHIGHLVLQGMLDNPKMTNQIDAATDKSETNGSVAVRSMQLASAFNNFGLKPGDAVVISGFNHLDIAIPFYACHYNGLSVCGVDPCAGLADLKGLYPDVKPKITFCQRNIAEHVKEAYATANMEGKIIVFDDEKNNMENFIQEYNGTEVNFRPAEFDHSEIPAWLILTSGTTGNPKVAIIPYDTLLNGMCCWWRPFTTVINLSLTMSSFQWLSALIYFICGPLRKYTRLQCSLPLNAPLLVSIINKYKPELTAWIPHLLGQFLAGTEKVCDVSCFKFVVVTGNPMEKSVLDKFKERTNAYLYLAYSMTELLVPGFDYNSETPFGSVGKPYEKYQYKLIDDQGHRIDKPFKNGELYIKGDDFFKGYLANPEETNKMLTEDGWFKTGDMFYRDEDDNYYFVERKRLLIKSSGYWVSPLQLEGIIKKHPNVANVCVVGIPDKERIEAPVAAIVKRPGTDVKPKEIFDLITESNPEPRHLHGGLFFMDALPMTPSGKVHRYKIKEITLTADRIMPPAK
ncbi:unnamed protein product [Diatraea saccharalis]|uniref:Luciferin 4-monooxygenase-like n=1 Tax=Diatraea saccharalis TaxID=40085 RepID=A0A9N9W9T6_9NEOP|nr:unnamed protein product [Diatraea saccharalis]